MVSDDSSLMIVGYSDVDWPETLKIEITHLVLVFLLEIVLWLSLVRNKILYLYLLLKLRILLLGVVVCNSYG